MADSIKQKDENVPSEEKQEKDSFYEAMPAAWGSYPFAGTEAPAESVAEPAQDETEDYARTSKITAIITIVLTILVAIALTILFIGGINTINNSAPTQSDSTGTLEL